MKLVGLNEVVDVFHECAVIVNFLTCKQETWPSRVLLKALQ